MRYSISFILSIILHVAALIVLNSLFHFTILKTEAEERVKLVQIRLIKEVGVKEETLPIKKVETSKKKASPKPLKPPKIEPEPEPLFPAKKKQDVNKKKQDVKKTEAKKKKVIKRKKLKKIVKAEQEKFQKEKRIVKKGFEKEQTLNSKSIEEDLNSKSIEDEKKIKTSPAPEKTWVKEKLKQQEKIQEAPKSHSIIASPEEREVETEEVVEIYKETSEVKSEEYAREYEKKYLEKIRETIRSYLSYPFIARRMGWQGEVIIRVTLDPEGNLVSLKVEKSSGFEVLDKNALEVIRIAYKEFPQPKTTITFLIPIVYKLR